MSGPSSSRHESSMRETPSTSAMPTNDGSSTKTIMCRKYMIGKCRKARKCKYSHSMDHLPTSFCRDYIFKYCRYGSRCTKKHLNPREENRREVLRKKYITKKNSTWHDANDFEPGLPYVERQPLPPNVSSLEELKAEPLCQRAIEGTCNREQGDCIFLHGFTCEHCQKPVIHPFDRVQGRTHKELCARTAALLKNYRQLVKDSENEECGICYDKVLSPEKNEELRKFGLLPGCMHKFCLACIRRWRTQTEGSVSTENRRSCPNCRQKSYFIVPSQVWIPDTQNKKMYIEEYKLDLKRKPCKYQRHDGNCPFAHNCFYNHEITVDGQGEPFMPRDNQSTHNDNDVLPNNPQRVNFNERFNEVIRTLNALQAEDHTTNLESLRQEIETLQQQLQAVGIGNVQSRRNNTDSNNSSNNSY